MPSSLGSQDSHLSGSSLLPPLSEDTSSRSSQSTPASIAHWTFEDAASSDRKSLTGLAFDRDTRSPLSGETLDPSSIVRPEPLRAFQPDPLPSSAVEPIVADKSLSSPQQPSAGMTAISRSIPGLSEPGSSSSSSSGCRQQQGQQQHRQPYQPQQRQPEHRDADMQGHHQAANYASLAAIATKRPSVPSSGGYATVDKAVESWNTLNDPSYAGAVRLLTENLLSAEAAPRLSTSSVESTVTSELHTPDNCTQPWNLVSAGFRTEDALAHDKALPVDGPHTAGLHIGGRNGGLSPSPTGADKSGRVKRPARLSRLSSNATNVTARLSPPASLSSSPVAQATASTAGADGNRVPDVSSLRVDDGGDSAGSSSYLRYADAGPSSRAGSVYSPAAESVDFGDHEGRFQAGTAGRRILASPDSWRSLLPEHDPFFVPESSFLPPSSEHTFSRAVSLAPLPTSPKPQQPQQQQVVDEPWSSRDSSHTAAAALDRKSVATFDSGRSSFSSAMSQQTSSWTGGVMADTDSWRSFLPDSDRFSLRNAPSPRPGGDASGHQSPQTGSGDHSAAVVTEETGQLDLPIILDESGHRAAFMALRGIAGQELAQQLRWDASTSAARRHASFSSYEPTGTANATGTSRTAMASTRRPTVVEALNGKRGQASQPSTGPSHTVKGTSSPLASVDSHTYHLSLTSSSSSFDFDDVEDRESWPTSKGRSKYFSGSSSEHDGFDAETAFVDATPSSGATADCRRPATDPKSGKIDEKSSSFLQKTSEGLVATTTTKTTRTTIAQKLIAPSGADTNAEDANADAHGSSTVGSEGSGDRGGAMRDEPESVVESDNAMQPSRRTASCSISAPRSPPTLPFLDSRPAPPETELFVETGNTQYTLITHLPGFSIDCITLATKQHQNHRTLHLVADKFDDDDGGHFERRVTFPEGECDLVGVRAEFDGTILRIFVPRKDCSDQPGFSSASSATF